MFREMGFDQVIVYEKLICSIIEEGIGPKLVAMAVKEIL
jgi:hypothetical protein